MLAADHRVHHEKLDRMVNADAAEDIVAYFRRFIDIHFEVLRRRQMEVKYLAQRLSKHDTSFKANFGKVPDIPVVLQPHDNLVAQSYKGGGAPGVEGAQGKLRKPKHRGP
jgi:hypothetical protein